MAETAILTALIPKLVEVLHSEVNLHKNIRNYLESIKREVECMKEFLMAADDTCGNDVWLTQVRELSFESEDIVDEFMLDFSRDDISRPSWSRLITSMNRNWIGQRDIASRMRDIIDKFEEIQKSNARYDRTDKLEPLVNPSAAGRGWHNPQLDVFILCQDGLIGTEMHEKNLIAMLLNATGDDASMNVVSVFGMGGVGKTSLVKKVYDNAEVANHFQGRVWITASQKFKSDDILNELFQSLTYASMRPEPEEHGNMQSRQTIIKTVVEMGRFEKHYKIKSVLAGRKYLIVLDDVWSIDDWNSVKDSVVTACGCSQLMITTRDKATAQAACRQADRIYELKPLSNDDSFDLFCTKTFGSPSSCPAHLKDVSKNIIKKCAGLPLAIVAISGVLASKDPMAQADVWGRIDCSLEKEFESLQTIFLLSYNDLRYYLKPCLLYLSIFPEDHLIQKMRLMRLWIAEGFVERKDSASLEETAESYLDELVSKSLIQIVERTGDGKVDTCRVHDLIREMIIKKATDQKFAAIAKDYQNPNSPKFRRLSFSSDLGMVQHHPGLGQHRSLLMFNLICPVSVLSMPSLFSKNFNFKLLTVLDLQGTILDKFPSTIVKLKNLKYLNLSHTDVKEVPRSIGNLRKLETLDLRSTLVSKLPKEILKLQQLRDLLVYHAQNEEIYGVRAPAGIQYLPSLENLLIVDAGHYFSKAAEKVPPLRRLCVKNLSNNNAGDVCSFINDLRYLQVLSISSLESGEWAMDLQQLVSLSNSLRLLYVSGKLLTVPKWMETMGSLVTIHLGSSKLQDDPADIFGQLPSLMHLELSDAYTGAEMRFKAGHFQRLRVLGIIKFMHLEKVIFEDEAVPNLERLSLENTRLMKMVPTGIENLHKLKELNFVEMASELAIAIRGSGGQGGTEYDKIKHVKEVNWVYHDHNAWMSDNLLTISTGGNEESRKPRILGWKGLVCEPLIANTQCYDGPRKYIRMPFEHHLRARPG